MPDWVLAPSLVRLRSEVDAKWPNRSKASDGTIGDAAHRLRKSDHNPDSRGIVRAIDITTADSDEGRNIRKAIILATVRDPRVSYVIANGMIYSPTSGWLPTRYPGTNPHISHIHVSVNESGANNDSPWKIGGTLSQAGIPNPLPKIKDLGNTLLDMTGIITKPITGKSIGEHSVDAGETVAKEGWSGLFGNVAEYIQGQAMRVVYWMSGMLLLALAAYALLRGPVGKVRGVLPK